MIVREQPSIAPGTWTLTEYPRPVPPSRYTDALDRMAKRVRDMGGVRSVYQIGGVSTPGISDLDMVVVFADGVTCQDDPTRGLDGDDAYLFIHKLYGTSVSLFRQAQRHSFFHNYRLLHGTDLLNGAQHVGPEHEERLKQQIALEYLLKMYINLTWQRAYGALKLRSFFLHVKAVAYDLEFLNVTSGDLYDLTHQLIGWRNAWFQAPPSEAALIETVDRFYAVLQDELGQLLRQQPLAWSGGEVHRVARSLWVKPGSRLRYERRGLLLPRQLGVLGVRYLKLQNRLNRLEFEVPVQQDPMPAVLKERFALVRTLKAYNEQTLPGFATLTTSLGLA